MLGLQSAGKTTILNKLRYNDISCEAQPTIGFNAEMVTYDNLKLNIWDVSGSEKSRMNWQDLYFHGTKGLIFVIDSTNQQRLDLVRDELLKCDQELKLKVPFLILANKQDIPGKMDAEIIRRQLRLELFHEKRQIFIQPTCAYSGQGLCEAIRWLKKKMWPSCLVNHFNIF